MLPPLSLSHSLAGLCLAAAPWLTMLCLVAYYIIHYHPTLPGWLLICVLNLSFPNCRFLAYLWCPLSRVVTPWLSTQSEINGGTSSSAERRQIHSMTTTVVATRFSLVYEFSFFPKMTHIMSFHKSEDMTFNNTDYKSYNEECVLPWKKNNRLYVTQNVTNLIYSSDIANSNPNVVSFDQRAPCSLWSQL